MSNVSRASPISGAQNVVEASPSQLKKVLTALRGHVPHVRLACEVEDNDDGSQLP